MTPRADIAKCQGSGCTRRDSCIRFVAPEGKPIQNWIAPDPVGCANFASVETYRSLYESEGNT